MDLKKIKGLLWDNDGVLVDTEPLYFKSNQLAMAEVGVEISPEEFTEYFLKSARGGQSFLEERSISEQKARDVLARRFEIYIDLLGACDYAKKGAFEVLREAGEFRKMAIVTSCLPQHFQIIKSKYSFYSHFDFFLTREAYEHPKPHPQCYQMALEKMGFGRDEVLVVEDSERGLKAAHGAGLACAVIPSGLTRGLDFTEAAYVLKDLGELMLLLRGL